MTSIGIAMLLVIILIIAGVPIMYAFMAAALGLVVLLDLDPSFIISYGYDSTNAVVLLCVPLYVCVGTIMAKSNIGSALINFVDLFVGRIRGGLGIAGVFASAIFGAISGSTTATLTCIGPIVIPKMIEDGYPRGHAAALITNACPLGYFIPPSALMIIFAWSARQSILACFLATVIPGIILATLLSATNVVMLRNVKNLKSEEKIPSSEIVREVFSRVKWSVPAILMPVIILGGTYSGVFTPTESAAIAIFYAVPVGMLIYKKLTWKALYETLADSATTTGVIMVMIFCVMVLSRIMVMQDLPSVITDFLHSISNSKYVILMFINIVLIILGMIMDDTSSMLLAVPILMPIARSFGIDPIQLGAIMGMNLGLGLITPPCAMMLYFGSRVSKVPVAEMMKPTLMFIAFAWVPTLLLTTYIPALSLWLPRLVLGKGF
ncbi:TRAP transporter large permease [Synergistes jonesii]|uniref:C4-dicarboxylate ABC transporter permease n=1 Tax=Synergistes jonesii TaxID=2754 RepID=A0A073INV7_9BACT|nr:TRAP transporter large permease [Synergistes jonesii]KEJ92008.1 C4-dicarboxylate ABC transporter permease [Synergistes jonesii]OFB61958.1 C4-dicarboxylate ABC transporter permease [Synergistes jonesii]OFB62564.1 C4-dicarboxylate ABC transporter permease [Synergistes jonesii]OFB64252.1 C4-dicarboxylate ABC transporter permease [Synergistes jonesii]OFB67399.1 C4-dicarboxylate ABC transporter permease [Synergistes jonesii]